MGLDDLELPGAIVSVLQGDRGVTGGVVVKRKRSRRLRSGVTVNHGVVLVVRRGYDGVLIHNQRTFRTVKPNGKDIVKKQQAMATNSHGESCTMKQSPGCGCWQDLKTNPG